MFFCESKYDNFWREYGEKLSKRIFWVISIFFGVVYIFTIIENKDSTIIFLFIGILVCPLTLDFLFKKLGITKVNYNYGVRLFLIFGGIILAYILTICVVLCTDIAKDAKTASENVESIIKLIIYIIYIIVVFLNNKVEKETKYICFGIFYVICIILSYASPSIYRPIVVFFKFF